MKESFPIPTGREEQEKERAEKYFEVLDLDWEYLKDKKIAEIGAGIGNFAAEAKKHGIDVIALEGYPDNREEQEKVSENVCYVVGNAREIPFKDESLDLVIAHAAPPIIVSTKEEARVIIKEAMRVLKEGGELRFGPAPLYANIFETEELFTKEEEESFSTEERIARIGEKSFEFLKTIDPNVTLNKEEGANYYSIIK